MQNKLPNRWNYSIKNWNGPGQQMEFFIYHSNKKKMFMMLDEFNEIEKKN